MNHKTRVQTATEMIPQASKYVCSTQRTTGTHGNELYLHLVKKYYESLPNYIITRENPKWLMSGDCERKTPVLHLVFIRTSCKSLSWAQALSSFEKIDPQIFKWIKTLVKWIKLWAKFFAFCDKWHKNIKLEKNTYLRPLQTASF